MILWYVIPLFAIACVLWYYHSVCLICLQKTHTYDFLMYYVVARWRLSLCHASMTDAKYVRGRKVLRKGHVILTRDDRALSTWLVPGYHTHALLCIGEINGIMMCAEMTRHGYGEVTFAKAAWHSSGFVILECPDWDVRYTHDVITRCRAFKDTEYDTQFKLGPDKVYCTELIELCDTEGSLRIKLSRAWGTGQWVVKPADILAANVDVSYDSDEEQA